MKKTTLLTAVPILFITFVCVQKADAQVYNLRQKLKDSIVLAKRSQENLKIQQQMSKDMLNQAEARRKIQMRMLKDQMRDLKSKTRR